MDALCSCFSQVRLSFSSANPLDVNNDNLVTPVADVLPMINELNRRRLIDSSGRLPEERPSAELFYDVNGDGFLTAAGDVLLAINFLNQQAESESAEALLVADPTSREVPIDGAVDTLARAYLQLKWIIGKVES